MTKEHPSRGVYARHGAKHFIGSVSFSLCNYPAKQSFYSHFLNEETEAEQLSTCQKSHI